MAFFSQSDCQQPLAERRRIICRITPYVHTFPHLFPPADTSVEVVPLSHYPNYFVAGSTANWRSAEWQEGERIKTALLRGNDS